MDLAGHHRFQRDAPLPASGTAQSEAMLAAGWAALATARAETLEIRLKTGAAVPGILALRIDGTLVEASTVRGQWTHYFPVADVSLVQVVPRGGAKQRP